MDSLQRFLMLAPALLLSITVHEYAHGWMAKRRGDDTAELMGRLSLNPLVHLDLLGTAVLLLTGLVGWAKPVPVNPGRLRRPATDMVWVALAGPAANLALMIALVLLIKGLFLAEGPLVSLLSPSGAGALVNALFMAAFLNLGLAFFNLLPVPPLDGFRVVALFIPAETLRFLLRFQIVFFIALLVLMRMGFFSGALRRLESVFLSLF